MRKTLIRTLLTTVFLSAICSFGVFAATINQVSFRAYVENDEISGDVTDPTFEATGTNSLYELSEFSLRTSDTASYRYARTYELIFSALGNNLFNDDASSITVRAQGVESIISRRVRDDGETLVVRVTAYPFAKLPESTINSLPDTGASTLRILKGSGVSTVEYYLVYTDYYGDTHTVHNSTNSSSINVSTYTRRYSGNNESLDDRAVVGVHLRSLRATDNSNPNLVPSDWWGYGQLPTNADLENYDSWSSYLGSTNASGSLTSDGVTSSSASSDLGDWVHSEGYWYFRRQDGSPATGWINDGSHWYYLETTTGRMLTGWITDTDGRRYFLNPYEGGPLGSMVTDWYQDSDGGWYYLNPLSGGPMGSVATGWIYDGDRWYYCDASNGGRMVTGWFTDTDGQRYYLNPNSGGPMGSMLTGWQLLDDKWYYFREVTAEGQGSQGAAIINRQVSINGIVYTFDADGAMIETVQ